MAVAVICRNCNQEFLVEDVDLGLYEKISPVFNNEKFLIPPPTFCPQCRQQRRWAVRNENKLYKRKCDFSGEMMISLYSADKPFKVYKEEIWWSDKWDPLDYGRGFDSKQSFFEQIKDLQLAVPRREMHQDGTNQNCEYTTFGMSNKDCYLAFACFYCKEVFYSSLCGFVNNSFDCFMTMESELSYECVDCRKCYECFYCKDCIGCSDSYLMDDCRNCQHCIGCKNLRNKEYHIYNKPVTKEEFENYKKNIYGKNLLKEKGKFDRWKLKFPYPYAHIVQSENSSGDYLEQAKDCHNCYDIVLKAENCRHCQSSSWNNKDMIDCTMTGKNSELLYEMTAVLTSYHSAFNNFCRFVKDVYYSNMVSNCENCFGCIGLNYKKYCIFNRQYTKEEYDELVPRIIEHMKGIGEWGEFFPIQIAPFAYNETLAQEYYPLTKEAALVKGYQWKNVDVAEYQPATFKLTADLNEISDSIVKEILVCSECKKNYRIIAQELAFYRSYRLAVPGKCQECRHKSCIALRNPRRLWAEKCFKCNKEIKTSYAPVQGSEIDGGGKILYCESCYLKEIY